MDTSDKDISSKQTYTNVTVSSPVFLPAARPIIPVNSSFPCPNLSSSPSGWLQADSRDESDSYAARNLVWARVLVNCHGSIDEFYRSSTNAMTTMTSNGSITQFLCQVECSDIRMQ